MDTDEERGGARIDHAYLQDTGPRQLGPAASWGWPLGQGASCDANGSPTRATDYVQVLQVGC